MLPVGGEFTFHLAILEGEVIRVNRADRAKVLVLKRAVRHLAAKDVAVFVQRDDHCARFTNNVPVLKFEFPGSVTTPTNSRPAAKRAPMLQLSGLLENQSEEWLWELAESALLFRRQRLLQLLA